MYGRAPCGPFRGARTTEYGRRGRPAAAAVGPPRRRGRGGKRAAVRFERPPGGHALRTLPLPHWLLSGPQCRRCPRRPFPPQDRGERRGKGARERHSGGGRAQPFRHPLPPLPPTRGAPATETPLRRVGAGSGWGGVRQRGRGGRPGEHAAPHHPTVRRPFLAAPPPRGVPPSAPARRWRLSAGGPSSSPRRGGRPAASSRAAAGGRVALTRGRQETRKQAGGLRCALGVELYRTAKAGAGSG